MLRTKVIKVESSKNADVIVTLKTLFLFPSKSKLIVQFSDEYKEIVKGEHNLLNNLYDKFENKEAELFLKRYWMKKGRHRFRPEAEREENYRRKRMYVEAQHYMVKQMVP